MENKFKIFSKRYEKLIFSFIALNFLLGFIAKSFYANPEIAYRWFDITNYIRYIIYDILVILIIYKLSFLKTPLYLMLLFLTNSLFNFIMYFVNGNNNTLIYCAFYTILSILTLFIFKPILLNLKTRIMNKPKPTTVDEPGGVEHPPFPRPPKPKD